MAGSRVIEVSRPKDLLESQPPGNALSEDELNHLVGTRAEYLWLLRVRKTRRST
jgi:hypothetical protein